MIVLIHPPVAKPCEAPAGITRLSGMLSEKGIQHRLLDANLEGLLFLLEQPVPSGSAAGVWTRRALRDCEGNVASLRRMELYRNIDRYGKAVRDLGRVLAQLTPDGVSLGLANYEQKGFSPLRSRDLVKAAERPEINPFFPYFLLKTEQMFRDKEPDVVGISLNFMSQAVSAFSLIGVIRRQLPRVKVILGGGLVTSWLRSPAWQNCFTGLVDHLVAGPGESHLAALLGVEWTEGGVSRPVYDTLPRERYLSPGFVVPYSASTGCSWGRCEFCPERAEGNPYVPVPSLQVLSDLKAIEERHGAALVHLLDNAVSPSVLAALSAEKFSVPWYGFARIGPHLADADFCLRLRRSGCVMLKLGIESGDQGVLDSMRKGTKVETASAVLKNLKKAGIATYVYLIFGTPEEKEASARKTLDFTVAHSDCIDFLNLAIFNMPRCAREHFKIETRNFSEGDLSLYTDFVHPHGWDRRRVRIFLDGVFKRHRAVSTILKNDPPFFTSNHAPFFVMGRGES